MKAYSTREVSELIGMPQEQIRAFARDGVIRADKTPGGHYRFSFQDIIILRSARSLLAASIPPTDISRSLSHLKQQLSSEQSLSALRVSALAGEVVYRSDDRLVSPESGQIHFEFEVADLADNVASLTRRKVERALKAPRVDESRMDSDDWFDLGVDLEDVSPSDAPQAYRKSLELDPKNTDAHINLGRLLQSSGQSREAETHYRAALEINERDELARFNLGTVLEDMGRIGEAIQQYQRCESYADAHFNLARIFEIAGKLADAFKHYRKYRELKD